MNNKNRIYYKTLFPNKKLFIKDNLSIFNNLIENLPPTITNFYIPGKIKTEYIDNIYYEKLKKYLKNNQNLNILEFEFYSIIANFIENYLELSQNISVNSSKTYYFLAVIFNISEKNITKFIITNNVEEYLKNFNIELIKKYYILNISTKGKAINQKKFFEKIFYHKRLINIENNNLNWIKDKIIYIY